MLLCTNIGVNYFEMHLYGKVLLIKYLQVYSWILITMSKYNGAVKKKKKMRRLKKQEEIKIKQHPHRCLEPRIFLFLVFMGYGMMGRGYSIFTGHQSQIILESKREEQSFHLVVGWGANLLQRGGVISVKRCCMSFFLMKWDKISNKRNRSALQHRLSICIKSICSMVIWM